MVITGENLDTTIPMYVHIPDCTDFIFQLTLILTKIHGNYDVNYKGELQPPI